MRGGGTGMIRGGRNRKGEKGAGMGMKEERRDTEDGDMGEGWGGEGM